MDKNNKGNKMNNVILVAIIAMCFLLVSLLDDQDLKVRQALAEEYANMIELERQCKDWNCYTDLTME